MRFLRGYARNTIHGHHRPVDVNSTHLRRHHCYFRRPSFIASRQDVSPLSARKPLSPYNPAINLFRVGKRHGSTATAEASAPEPQDPEDVEDTVKAALPERSAQLERLRRLLEDAKHDQITGIERVDFAFPETFASNLSGFLQSDAQICRFENCQLYRRLLHCFPATKGLSPVVLGNNESHIHHVEGIYLLKDEDDAKSMMSKHQKRSQIKEDLEAFMLDNLQEPWYFEEMKGLLKYRSDIYSSIPQVLAVCGNDITRLPTFDLLDKAGNSLLDNDTLSDDVWPCQVVFGTVTSKPIMSRESFLRAVNEVCLNWMAPGADRGSNSGVLEEPFILDPNGWQPAEFLSRAGRALGFGQLKFNWHAVAKTSGVSVNKEGVRSVYTLHLWKENAWMVDSNFHCEPIVWPSQKGARKLAMFRACIEMRAALRAALAAGKLLPNEYKEFEKFWCREPTRTCDVGNMSDETSSIHENAAKELHAPVAPPKEYDLEDGPLDTAIIDSRSIATMLSTLQELEKLTTKPTRPWKAVDETFPTGLSTSPVSLRQLKANRHLTPGESHTARLQAFRTTLPISQPEHKRMICDTIRNNDITILKATTGSGKTTQVPQFILDDVSLVDQNIACTQPRRIAAVSVAKRVAKERGQPVGYEVGFQVRFNDSMPTAAKGINYVTTGYLLRLFEVSPALVCNGYTHIIFDEVHERDIDTDLLLTGIKNVMKYRHIEGLRMPKIVLMSATINVDSLLDYFEDVPSAPSVASIEVPGKIYPVSTTLLDNIWPDLVAKYPNEMKNVQQNEEIRKYLEEQFPKEDELVDNETYVDARPDAVADQDNEKTEETEETAVRAAVAKELRYTVPDAIVACLVRDLLRRSDDGDILVFLPGLSDIEHVAALLSDTGTFALQPHHQIFRLHSAFGDNNFDVWEPLPHGFRRVILATNIAETSITLPDVTVVIDTGLSKQGDYDQTSQTESLGTRWVSKAEVQQRRGRAGRTREGRYYATYSQKQYDAMTVTQAPELLRSRLEAVVLRTASSSAFRVVEEGVVMKPGSILASAPSPPNRDNIDAAVDQLRRLHFFTPDLRLTPMGYALSQFPVEPALARLVLMGLLFRTLSPVMITACIDPERPLLHHPDKINAVARTKKGFAGRQMDDRMADVSAFLKYAVAEYSGDVEEKERLEQDFFLRPDTWTGVSRAAFQLMNSIKSMMDIPRSRMDDFDRLPIIDSLFLGPMAFPNQNSSNTDLFKALIIASAGMRIASWNGKHWRNKARTKILPSPRSVNHSAYRRELRAVNNVRREHGDLLCYLSLRAGPDHPPWASDTTFVSPLGAMLFAESLRVIDEETVAVNDWMKYKIQPHGELPLTAAQIVKVVHEYRKALDRFVAHAFADAAIEPTRLKLVVDRKMKASQFNTLLRNNVDPLRELFTKSLIDILRFDDSSRRERMEERRAQAEEEAPEDSKLKEFLVELKGNL